MTPFRLAWSNLAHKRGRSAVAIGGVAFAVVLIFMELGLLGGVGGTATMLFDRLQFDLLVTSSEYLDLSNPGGFDRARLAQARAANGVEEAIPLSFGVAGWRMPEERTLFGTTPGGRVMSINMIGIPPARIDRAFSIGKNEVFPTIEAAREAGSRLGQLDTFLFDRRSKPEFGEVERLVSAAPDHLSEPLIRVNGRSATVVGHFDLGTGFSWNGMLMTSDETYSRFMLRSTEQVNFGLLRLAPGADPIQVREELRSTLPGDVKVYTREEINTAERRYWLRLTSVGQFLVVAVILAIVVGIIFVYQMMAADIRNMLPEFATVKALGHRPAYLTGVVLWLALLFGVLGYLPGFLAALVLYTAARTWGGIPTEMTIEVALGVLALTCIMCLVSGLLAVRKVHAADPAELF